MIHKKIGFAILILSIPFISYTMENMISSQIEQKTTLNEKAKYEYAQIKEHGGNDQVRKQLLLSAQNSDYTTFRSDLNAWIAALDQSNPSKEEQNSEFLFGLFESAAFVVFSKNSSMNAKEIRKTILRIHIEDAKRSKKNKKNQNKYITYLTMPARYNKYELKGSLIYAVSSEPKVESRILLSRKEMRKKLKKDFIDKNIREGLYTEDLSPIFEEKFNALGISLEQ